MRRGSTWLVAAIAAIVVAVLIVVSVRNWESIVDSGIGVNG